MINILNQELKPLAILQNAYGIGYDKGFNEIWQGKFSLPLDDPKNKHCEAFNRVEIWDHDEYIGLFRIIPSLTKKDASNNSIDYQIEHVMATLLDDVLFQYHQLTNLTTRQVLQYVIDKQKTKHWKLGKVDFTRYFHYKWENENLLSALFSVPKPFDVQYQWTWDTQTYPWTLNLVAPEDNATCEIREGKNLIGFEIEKNPNVFNRIYPLGYGEGVNQLNIKKVNNGIPYVEDAASIAKYGLREYVWADKRFEKADSLKASGLALLKEWKEPIVSWRASAADLSSITGLSKDKFKMGRIVRVITNDFGIVDLRIEKESKPDITGKPGDIQLELGSKSEDISTTNADLERRQQINELYAQGATSMLAYSFNGNCDASNPAEIKFFLPDEMVRINKLLLTFETTNFEAYSKSAKAGGGQTTSSGGGVVKSTSAGGGQTTSSGGGQTTSSGGGATSSSGGGFDGDTLGTELDPDGIIPENEWRRTTTVDGHSHGVPPHKHRVFTPNHTHTVSSHTHTVSSHTHSVSDHSHSIELEDHTHTVQAHTHPLEYGIYKHSTLPSKVTIKVDGNTVPGTALEAENLNLIPYLSKDSNGDVTRGRHVITLQPDNLGMINANVITQFFIQSQGGGEF